MNKETQLDFKNKLDCFIGHILELHRSSSGEALESLTAENVKLKAQNAKLQKVSNVFIIC